MTRLVVPRLNSPTLPLAIALSARVMAWQNAPFLYPDAYFQYLEPAWQRVAGVGVQTWEWWVGLRSWILPSYHGAWMALWSWWGVPGAHIGEALKLHWGVLSLFMVWAAYRAGASFARQASVRGVRALGESGSVAAPWPSDGRIAGAFTALLLGAYPLVALYSVETLSETPSMIGIVSGLCLTAELVEARDRSNPLKAWLIGTVLSLSVSLRIVNGPLAVIAPFWLLCCGPRRMILPMLAGSVLPILVFGVVDRITWGRYFHSFITYLEFNIVQGRAADFGSAPLRWYVDKMLSRQPVGIFLLLAVALIGIRRTWPFVMGAIGMFVLVSVQAHKEERFMILIWPLLLIASGTLAGQWLQETRNTVRRYVRLRVLRAIAVLGGSAFVLWESFIHVPGHDLRLSRSRLNAEVWVAKRTTATGLLLDWNLYTGGYLWFGRALPLVNYQRELLANRIFSHVVVARRHPFNKLAKKSGFVPVWEEDSILVYERRPITGGSGQTANPLGPGGAQ